MLVAWLKKKNFNAKVTEIEGKIPSITGLATNSALTAVENKIPVKLTKNPDIDKHKYSGYGIGFDRRG